MAGLVPAISIRTARALLNETAGTSPAVTRIAWDCSPWGCFPALRFAPLPPRTGANALMRATALPSRPLQNLVLLAELVARHAVEIGAGDADHPGGLRVRGRVHDAGPIGARLPGGEAVFARCHELEMVIALRIDAAPFGHVGLRARIAVDRPRIAVAVRLAGLAAGLDMRQHVEVELCVVIELALAGLHVPFEGLVHEG